MLKIFILPILLIIISILWIIFPPKNRNYFYGYRTGTSMRSDENWHLANHLSSRILLLLSIVILVIHTIATVVIEDPTNGIINVLVISYMIITFIVIPITELVLRSKIKSKN